MWYGDRMTAPAKGVAILGSTGSVGRQTLDVIRHRLVLSYEALSDNVSSDEILKKVLDRIPLPVVPMHEHTNIHADA